MRQVVDSGRRREQVSACNTRAHAHARLACQHLRVSDCHRPEIISCDSVDDQCGWTPLRFAVQYGHIAVVNLLIQNGAEVNTKFASNKTSLHHACFSGNMEMCKLLLDAGALREHSSCFCVRVLLVCYMLSNVRAHKWSRCWSGHEPNPLDVDGFSPCDLVYCPKDEIDHLQVLLSEYGARRFMTVPKAVDVKGRAKVIARSHMHAFRIARAPNIPPPQNWLSLCSRSSSQPCPPPSFPPSSSSSGIQILRQLKVDAWRSTSHHFFIQRVSTRMLGQTCPTPATS